MDKFKFINATDNKLPIATGNTPDKGADLYSKYPNCNITLVPRVVKRKCKNDRNTMKLYPSFSVIYLLHITIPTTDKILPHMESITTMFNDIPELSGGVTDEYNRF